MRSIQPLKFRQEMAEMCGMYASPSADSLVEIVWNSQSCGREDLFNDRVKRRSEIRRVHGDAVAGQHILDVVTSEQVTRELPQVV